MQFADLLLKRAVVRGRHVEAVPRPSPAAAAVKAPWAASRRQVESWFGFTRRRRATRLTEAPGSRLSSTIRISSAALQRRRRCTDVVAPNRTCRSIQLNSAQESTVTRSGAPHAGQSKRIPHHG
jgi:hypothetical protein